MASWAALNAESVPRAMLEEARDGATQEAQDAHNAVLYGRALRLQQQQKVEEASAIYIELLETSPGLSSRLRYLCAKNLATLESERGAFETALQRYAVALALDDTDVLVWYQMGKTALATGQVWLARQAFEAGIKLDATFWPLAYSLCDVLHAVGDDAAYQRIAQYIVDKDPGAGRVGGPLYVMDSTVDPEFRGCTTKHTESSLKRRTPALEALDSAMKKRKVLTDTVDQQQQIAASRAPLKYVLQQSSWLTLGKLLLEAYDDVTSETDPSSVISFTRHVCIKADFQDDPSQTEPSTVQNTSQAVAVASVVVDTAIDEKAAVDVDLVTNETEEKADDRAAGEPIEIDDGEDGDHDDGGESAVQTNRRKSRRHQERLREEHELAAKLAREKNLAYRLQAFVPDIASEANSTPYREIVFHLDKTSVILEHTNGDFVHKFENVLPSAPTDETADSDDLDNDTEGGRTIGASTAVERDQISNFVASVMESKDGVDVVRLLQAYLNQCGAWAEQVLLAPSDDQDQTKTLHSVCLWAEKVVRGRLGTTTTTPGRANEKVTRTRVGLNRHPQDGLTIDARLFLLELHLDDVTHHKPQQGQPSSRKAMRSYCAQLDEIVRVAQAILLDICWSTNDIIDSDDSAKKSSRLLVRLFWLCARAIEQRGNTAAAKEYLGKCQQSLDELEQGALVLLPNLRSQTTISSASLEQKMTDLQFSNVCTEVQEMTTTSRFDEAQGRLLSRFFPANGQASRITELLDDFSASKQREQGRGDGADDSENNLLELLLESVENSTSSKCSDKILLLLVILSNLLDVLCENLEKLSALQKKADAERHTLTVAVQATELTVDRLASVIAGASDSAAAVCLDTKKAVMAVVTMLLRPKILLLFDSPRDVLQVLHEMADQLAKLVDEAASTSDDTASTTSQVFGPLVVAAATSFRTIRSLSLSQRQRLLNVLTAPAASTKSKKKQTIRYDRVRSYVQTALGLLAGHAHLLVSLIPVHQVKGLMEDCCLLLKEEEEMNRRHHDGDKTARKALAAGSVLFAQLVVALQPKDADKGSSLRKIVGLVRLLHERLGEHELCSLDCFDKSIGSGSCEGTTFVKVAANILQGRYADHNAIRQARRRQKNRMRERKQSQENSDATSDFEVCAEEENGAEDEEGFDHTLAQCYRCLYDAHLLPGGVDHKTGASIADLESASVKTAQHVAQFAIPVMLRQPPRSNAQKKENLKILFAIQRVVDCIEDENQLAAVAPPPLLLQYLSPTCLLSWNEEIPVAVLESMPATRADSCLEDLWFLLGENFILLRVRKRSNLSELIEMERKIKERMAYLLKDVQYYRPRRIKSWVRLGRSTEELYQVASDACALILGRKWRKSNLLTASLPSEPAVDAVGGACVRELPSFDDVVLGSSLFEKMKVWHELDDASHKSSYRVCFEKVPPHIAVGSVESDTTASAKEFSMEETAELFLAQVVEFSRRCFAMAASLAMRECQNRSDGDKVVGNDKHEISLSADGHEDTVELMQAAVEVHEDCGLLLYNQLREFAVLRYDDGILSSGVAPMTLYGQMIVHTLQCFQDGLQLSSKSNPDAHDVRFRLHYMIGKVLKKGLWFQRQLPHSSLAIPVTTPEDVMKCFANAEEEHEKGKMDKSIVHAFYQLQTTRLTLILEEPVTFKNLRLACEHFFEEASDEDSDEDEDQDMDEEKKVSLTTREKVGKEDVAALLKASEEAESKNLLHLAQGWLFFNVVDALESISDEDRYFHASRYTLAKAMYRYTVIVERLSALPDDLPQPSLSTSAKNCIAALADTKLKKKNDGNSSAEIALKEMHPLFDKRRPQVVAIWLSEHVPASKKFEELNQRQIKFDFCRLKYFSYFTSFLQENEAYGRLKEIGSWVIACKEEHDAIDEMLGIVFHARGIVQLSRLRDYVCTELVDQLEQSQKEKSDVQSLVEESADDQGQANVAKALAKEAIDPESASESLLKELSKAYVNYLDVVHASARLAGVMSDPVLEEIFSLAEFPLVCLYLIGATEFPRTFLMLQREEGLTATSIAAMMPKFRAVLLNGPSPEAVTACAAVNWKPLVQAARTFCENRWPERQSGKHASAGRHARRARQGKTAAATNMVAVSTHTPTVSTTPTAATKSSSTAGTGELQQQPVGGDTQRLALPPAVHVAGGESTIAPLQPSEV